MEKYIDHLLSTKLIVSFLKHHSVRKVVLSPGTRNIPFCNMVENDSFFECFSVVDERGAAFFALGLSQSTGEKVAISCTSGTAVSNYLSGFTEAYYSGIPLIALTFDRNVYYENQLETQKIDHMSILGPVSNKSVNLPIVKDDDDLWYCQRLLNEAFLEQVHHGVGPIHINVPILSGTNGFYVPGVCQDLTVDIKYISRVGLDRKYDIIASIKKYKNILLVIGSNYGMNEKLKTLIEDFSDRYSSPVIADNLSNYHGRNEVNPERIFKSLNAQSFKHFAPELVITIGNNFQERIKEILRNYKFDHWTIDEKGLVKDVFHNQSMIIESDVESFFKYMLDTDYCNTTLDYKDKWCSLNELLVMPDLEYGNYHVISELCKRLPNNSIVHTSILNATRITQFFSLNSSIKCFSNVNAFGIDGCLPTFMGQAYCTDNLAFLITGDLSIFYGMNSLAIRHRKNNVRILLINNHGASEFHISPMSAKISTIDKHIGVKHDNSIKGWALDSKYEYMSVRNNEELITSLDRFVKKSDKPILMEVFTDLNEDGSNSLKTYRYLEAITKKFIGE